MRPTLRVLALVAAMLAALTVTPPLARATPPAGYTLVWSDEFSGTALDTNYWNVLTGVYHDGTRTPNAISVANGLLTITTYTASSVHYTGFISTRDRYQPLYGYIEASISNAGASGVNQAFWMHSPTIGNPIGNAAVAGVEMDISEYRVHDNNNTDISDKNASATHWDGYEAFHKSSTSGLRGTGLATGFHTYALEWTPTQIKLYVDNKLTRTINQSPAYASGFLLGIYENAGWTGDVDPEDPRPKEFVVDYFRAYRKAG